MRTQGKITHWNEQKGYGFITPAAGAKQVFVHINAFINQNERPTIGQVVSFSLSTDKQGRPCAVRVARTGEKLLVEIKRNDSVLMVITALIFIAVVGLSAYLGKIHEYVLYTYLTLSLSTFVAYAIDKSAAQNGAWRISEATLHTLALFGGWPGALIAQQTLRHKSRKHEFRFVFWVTVVINCCFFAWLFTATGNAFLRSLIG